MMVLPPVAGVNVGHSTGGGLLDSFKSAISGATGGATTQVDPGPKGDGSVGLFDGVLKKALLGGAAGAAMGFIPFLPGGPVLGGIVGALGGAAMGVFSNWTKQKQIKQENEAMLAAMGVQVQDPNIQQVLNTGNVGQLIPMMQQASGSTVQQGTTVQQGQTAQQGYVPGVDYGDVTPEEIAAAQQEAIQQGRTPGVVQGATTQTPIPTQGTITVGSGAGVAINPNSGMNPGVAPANMGGGGSAGDVGRPAAPAGVNSNDVSAIAPQQAGVGVDTSAATDASEGAAQVAPTEAQAVEHAQILAMISALQKQIDLLKSMIENDERRKAETLDAQAKQMTQAA